MWFVSINATTAPMPPIASLAFPHTRSTLTILARGHVQVGMCQSHLFVLYALPTARTASLPPATAPPVSAHISSPTIPACKLVPTPSLEAAVTA